MTAALTTKRKLEQQLVWVGAVAPALIKPCCWLKPSKEDTDVTYTNAPETTLKAALRSVWHFKQRPKPQSMESWLLHSFSIPQNHLIRLLNNVSAMRQHSLLNPQLHLGGSAVHILSWLFFFVAQQSVLACNAKLVH